ncbi:MAG: HAMP domain-containing protein [Alphaproteobacteria bacterium]|nr:HAMP domain-containing protein [Alphaproteobacteria bacterium]MBU6471940.1 HAMP domain-containing protein [Alphaproteobacteria bacterium]MDE2011504.1 HAMP domain-containing protein [Alphaproteobacteria bacterium]MDE2071895.1 HAMP domain-containing protein [Alphaproteobacteria bacterium]MDE2350385.1 HAMP domain-containing protein [Alphaproteobacteria bacterium]
MRIPPSALRLQIQFILMCALGVAFLVFCAASSFESVAQREMQQRFQTISENELNSLHALVLSVMLKRRVDPDNVAIGVFNTWFKEQSADYPGRIWSAWGPKVVAYMARKHPSAQIKRPLDAIDQEALKTRRPVGRFVGSTYRYSMPIVLGVTSGTKQRACVLCHVDLMDMQKGDVIAVFSSSLETSAAVGRLDTEIRSVSLYVLLAGAAMLFVLWAIFRYVVANPLRKIIRSIGHLTNGDLSVTIPFTGRGDEIGEIGKSLEMFKMSLRHNRELLLRVEGANRELEATASQLNVALAHADAANRAKSSFLAAMSHELRTPLNAIIGFSEIMKAQLYGRVGNDTYRGYVDDIHNSGRHLLQLINDILDLSKSDAGELKLSNDIVDVNQLVDECLPFVRTQATRGNVRLSVVHTADAIQLRADARRIKQIVLNLLSNAVKFTPEGGAVTVSVRHHRDGIAIVVADSGIGIAEADIPVALARFGQIDNGLSRKYDGTGLGLPLAKELAELHGGSLSIESSPGKGTTVMLWLPPERLMGRAPVSANC